MTDFINLSCPNCGGPLHVSKDLTHAKCPYCGKETLVRAVDEKFLEIHSQCPICRRNDQTKKVSAIMASGGENKAYFAIPPKPARPAETATLNPPPSPVQGILKSTNNMLYTFIAACALAGASLICTISNSSSRGTGVFFLLLFGAAAAVLYFRYINEKQRNTRTEEDYRNTVSNYESQMDNYHRTAQKQRADQEELYQKWLANWEAAVAKWKTLYYCERDDCIFIPGQEATVPLKDIEKFCYQKS